jgi:hypothetical protein
MREEIGSRPKVIAFGSPARIVLGNSSVMDHVDPLLNLNGLRTLFERDRWLGEALFPRLCSETATCDLHSIGVETKSVGCTPQEETRPDVACVNDNGFTKTDSRKSLDMAMGPVVSTPQTIKASGRQSPRGRTVQMPQLQGSCSALSGIARRGRYCFVRPFRSSMIPPRRLTSASSSIHDR